MTVTNKAVGEQINLATVLNSKLEAPVLQSEMGLDAQATATKQAVRWDEFSVKHNNDGTFKTGIIAAADIADGTIMNAEISASAAITGSKLANATVTATQIANTTITDAQISTSAAIVASKLAIQKMYKQSPAANPSATANTDGTVVNLTPPTGYVCLMPRHFDIVFGGTFGSETVTTNITVTFSDSTTALITKTATTTGTVSTTGTDLMTLCKDGVYINKIAVKSQSTIASSTATVVVNHYGFYL